MISLPFVFPLDIHNSGRGVLTCVPDDLDFRTKRTFVLSFVPEDKIRGDHAHRSQSQIILCSSGSFRIDAWTPTKQYFRRYKMDMCRDLAFYLPPMVYVRLHEFTEDGVAVVLSDGPYDPHEVIEW